MLLPLFFLFCGPVIARADPAIQPFARACDRHAALFAGILAIAGHAVQAAAKTNRRVPTMKRLIAALLLGATPVLTAPAMAFDIGAMTDAEKADFGAAVREYLMANPQVLIESINELESRQAEQAAKNDVDLVAQNHDAIFDDGHSWVGGNPDGDLTMVEFMDYRCGVCRQFNQEVVDAVKIAREQGVTIIGISDSAASPVIIGSEHGFVVSVDTPQYFPSSVATVALLETLLSFVVASASPTIIDRVGRFHDRRHELGLYVSERGDIG